MFDVSGEVLIPGGYPIYTASGHLVHVTVTGVSLEPDFAFASAVVSADRIAFILGHGILNKLNLIHFRFLKTDNICRIRLDSIDNQLLPLFPAVKTVKDRIDANVERHDFNFVAGCGGKPDRSGGNPSVRSAPCQDA